MNKILRSKSELPAWFPLKIYEEVLDGEGWANELAIRYAVQSQFEHTKEVKKSKDVFNSLIIRNERGPSILADVPHIRDVAGIRLISAFEVGYLSSMLQNCENGRQLSETIMKYRSDGSIFELMVADKGLEAAKNTNFSEYIDWDAERFHVADVVPGVPVTVDLEQDDETLRLMFDVFLAGVREVENKKKKPFDESDFSDWRKYGVLQIFDLQFWASFSGSRFSDNLIANVLWPHDEIDTTERVRKVSRPKVKEIFTDWSIIGRLHRQMQVQMALEKLIETESSDQIVNPE